MGWRPSVPSWRRSSVRRTWSSGWLARSSRRPGRLQSWSQRPTGSLRSSWMCRLHGRCVGHGNCPLRSWKASEPSPQDFLPPRRASQLWWSGWERGSFGGVKNQSFQERSHIRSVFAVCSTRVTQAVLPQWFHKGKFPGARVCFPIKSSTGAAEITHWVKTPAAKPDDLGLISRTHVIEGKRWFLRIVLWPVP